MRVSRWRSCTPLLFLGQVALECSCLHWVLSSWYTSHISSRKRNHLGSGLPLDCVFSSSGGQQAFRHTRRIQWNRVAGERQLYVVKVRLWNCRSILHLLVLRCKSVMCIFHRLLFSCGKRNYNINIFVLQHTKSFLVMTKK